MGARRRPCLYYTSTDRLGLDGNVVMHGGHTFGVLRDHGRQVAGILGWCAAAQPYDTVLVGIDFDAGERGQVLSRKLCFHLGCDGRVLHVVV
jgi:hypothetical protein